MSEILTKKEEILKRLLEEKAITFQEMLLFLKDEIKSQPSQVFRGLGNTVTNLPLTNTLIGGMSPYSATYSQEYNDATLTNTN